MGQSIALKMRAKESSLLYKRSKGEKIVFIIAFALFVLYKLISLLAFVLLIP